MMPIMRSICDDNGINGDFFFSHSTASNMSDKPALLPFWHSSILILIVHFPELNWSRRYIIPQTSCMSIWSLNRLHLKDLDQYIVSNNEENGSLYAKSQYKMLLLLVLLLYVPSRSSNVCLIFYLFSSLLINYVQLLPFTTIAD